MSYVNTVKAFIVDSFLFGDDSQLENETSFLNEGIIDSTGILELITFLEETYSIKIEDSELIPENLDSLNNIDHYLMQKINACAH